MSRLFDERKFWWLVRQYYDLWDKPDLLLYYKIQGNVEDFIDDEIKRNLAEYQAKNKEKED